MRPGVPTTTWTRRFAQLAAHLLAAVDRQDMEVRQVAGVALEGFRHLDGQLPGGGQHQYLGLGLAFQLAQQGQGEGGGLAGAGLGNPQQVMAGKQQRNALFLDGGGLFITQLLERLENGRRQAEIGEGGSHGVEPADGTRERALVTKRVAEYTPLPARGNSLIDLFQQSGGREGCEHGLGASEAGLLASRCGAFVGFCCESSLHGGSGKGCPGIARRNFQFPVFSATLGATSIIRQKRGNSL